MGHKLFPTIDAKNILSLEILFQTVELGKKLLANYESKVESGSTTVSHFGKEFVQLIQKSHPVDLAMQLFLRAVGVEDLSTMMYLF